MSRIYVPLIALLIMSCLTGCATVRKSQSGRIHHVVLCWLKEPGNEKARGQLIAASKTFAEIPGVITVHAGRVLPSKRTIVDSSFDVALVETFANRKDMASYLVHPIHQKAVQEVLKPLVKRLLVYDFVEE